MSQSWFTCVISIVANYCNWEGICLVQYFTKHYIFDFWCPGLGVECNLLKYHGPVHREIMSQPSHEVNNVFRSALEDNHFQRYEHRKSITDNDSDWQVYPTWSSPVGHIGYVEFWVIPTWRIYWLYSIHSTFRCWTSTLMTKRPCLGLLVIWERW